MPVARIVCSCTFTVELYDELDSPEGRQAVQAAALEVARENAANPQNDPKKLNPDAGALNEEGPPLKSGRPYFVLDNVRPISWSLSFNSFRRADEAEFTIPLALLPVPPDAIRAIGVYAAVRHLGPAEWEMFQSGEWGLLDDNLSLADFCGVCTAESISIEPGGIPTAKLPFRDYLGLLASKKVPIGKTLDGSLLLSQAIAKFLEGEIAEGMPVVWVDTAREPDLGEHIPKAMKRAKKGKKPAKPVKPQQSLLDAITEECARLGCVPRLNVNRLEISNAGPLYEGQLAKTKAKIVVSDVVESIEAEHTLIGVKSQSIQVVGYNPDSGNMLTARWPPDPKSAKSQTVEPGKPPRLPPLAANVGLPGYEQLEESILLIPVGAIASQEKLLEMAKMIFLERTRQRVRYTIKTHAPWANPLSPDDDGGTLLRLRAGDTIDFAYLARPDEAEDGTGALLPPVVRALTGNLSAEGNATLLERVGVASDVAKRIGELVRRAPRLSIFRVDEVHVTGGEKQDAELAIKFVNFTQIIDDVQREAEGREAEHVIARLAQDAGDFATKTVAEIEQAFVAAQKALNEALDGADNAEKAEQMQAELDGFFRRAMKGR